ncbi:MAG TPA: sulfite exporter TauE/SafE family protein [Candidatus Acidoferrales bacterium]|nr:sulfite exporter TauE/SafE family protein [Candidatus Acidoferrales bacterium]
MPAWPEVAASGLVVGILFGLFGVGGSSFATPALGLLGVPGLIAIAAPLPATIPAALVGMVTYVRRRQVEWPVARWCIYGGVPATIVGALLSDDAGGRALLIASGVVLAAVGVRILMPLPEGAIAGTARRRPGLVIPAAAAIGFCTGLLANGGGFLLVPLFVLVLGLTMPESAGTSLVVIAVLSIPTLATHWALGHIDWSIAAAFAVGSIPGAGIGSRLAQHVPAQAMKRTFGVLLIAFAIYFVSRQVMHP